MKYLLLAFFLCAIGYADLRKEIAICANKNDDAHKIICYDSLAKKINVDKPIIIRKKIKDKGQWVVTKELSPIDDSKKVTMFLSSEAPVKIGYDKVRPTLLIRCSEGKTSVFIDMKRFLGVGTITVLMRFDKEKAEEDSWNLSTSHTAIFWPWAHADYAKALMKHKKLLIQLIPYGENSVMTTFNLAGIGRAIQPLRDACQW